MRSKLQCFLFVFATLLFVLPSAFASSQKSFMYTGQSFEQINLEDLSTQTRYRDEVRYETCTREVPYTEQICQNEVHYRVQCYYGPSHQECYNQGGGVVCQIINGRRVCRTEPPHQVCRTVPGRQICQNVPYYEQVCRPETRYRTETYSCPRTVSVPYSVTVGRITTVEVEFDNAVGNVQAEFTAVSDQFGNVRLLARDMSPVPVLIIATPSASSTNTDGEIIRTNIHFRVSFLFKDRVLSPLSLLDGIQLSRDQVRFVIGKPFNLRQVQFKLTFIKDGLFIQTRPISAENVMLKDIPNGTGINSQTIVTIDLRNIPELSSLFLNNGDFYNLTVETSLNLGGNVVNSDLPALLTQKRTVMTPVIESIPFDF